MLKRLEIILTLLIVVAIVGSLSGAGYFNVILMICITPLAGIYFYLSIALFNGISFRDIFKKERYGEISTKRMIGTIGMGISFSIILMGFLFKFLLLPGASQMLSIGVVQLSVVSLVAVYKLFTTNQSQIFFYRNAFKRIIPIYMVGLFMYLLPPDTLIDFKFRDYPEYAELLKKSIEDPTNEQLQQELQEERAKFKD
ncbi:MAG: hypothetical protein OEY34_00720 [Cyclobacteriaceae bacterium]|nr:hypothetical protein [Cyclobacteriaceae bacterium]